VVGLGLGGLDCFTVALLKSEIMIKGGFVFAISFVLLSCSLGPRPFNLTPSQYRVRYGDTLYAIAWRYKLDAKKLANWNSIQPPFIIKSGQRLHLRSPPGYRKPAAAPPPVARVPRPVRKPIVSAPKPKNKPPVIKAPTVATAPPKKPIVIKLPRNRDVTWQWPARGTVVAQFSDNGVGKSGINIQGRPGQSVLAAASGKVVYSGNGLKGYGELIIIKHSEDLLSAYAYNRKRLVKEGSWVEKGQRIAELGDEKKALPLLHFEIRKKGKPINPINHLPHLP
jgi:lipoprotein NlpD